jgi:anti-sigma factor RsiW
LRGWYEMRRSAESGPCERLAAQLPDLAVGALDARRAQAVREHLAACEECAEQLRALEDLGRLLDAVGTEAAPRDLWAGIAPRLRPRGPRWIRLLAPAAGTAALAVAALVLLHRPTPPPAVGHQAVVALRSTGAYDVVPVSAFSDDADVLSLYARSASRGDWIGPAAGALYLTGAGKDAAP